MKLYRGRWNDSHKDYVRRKTREHREAEHAKRKRWAGCAFTGEGDRE